MEPSEICIAAGRYSDLRSEIDFVPDFAAVSPDLRSDCVVRGEEIATYARIVTHALRETS